MEFKDELNLIEQERNPYLAIRYIEISENQNLYNYLRIIFVLLDFLVDGRYSENEHALVSSKIKQIFNEAKIKYLNDYDFMFYSAVMIYIAEWYFGMNSTDEAKVMLSKAMQDNPSNMIYEWGYFAIVDQRINVNTRKKFTLSSNILKNKSIIKSIKEKGLLGEYISGIIESTYVNTKKQIGYNL